MASLVKTAMVKIVADDGDTQEKLDRIAAKAEELGRLNPDIKVKIDAAAASAEMMVLRRELKDTGKQADDSRGSFLGLSGNFSKMATSAGDAVTTAGQFAAKWAAIGLGIAVVAAPLADMAASVGAFAVLAVPELAKVQAALGQTGAAAKKAWAQLTPGERQVGGDLKQLMADFHGVQHALQPVIDHTMGLAVKLGAALMPALQSLASAGARTLNNFIKPLTAFADSGSFRSLITQIGQFSVQAMKAFGPSLISVMKQTLQILVSFSPAGIKLTEAILKLTEAFLPLINLIARLSGALLLGVIGPVKAATIILTGFDRAGRDLTAHWSSDWAEIVTTTANAAQAIISAVTRTISTVTGWFARLPGQILGALASLPGQMVSIGVNILLGLLRGLESEGGSILSYVSNLAGSIISDIGSALGIGSPSRITYQHGVWLAQGLALGMDAGHSQVTASARRMAAATLGGAAGGYGTGAGGVVRVQLEWAPGTSAGEPLIQWLRQQVRVKGGGSVQTALGRP